MSPISLDEESVKYLFEQSAKSRIYVKQTENCSFDRIRQTLTEWKRQNSVTIFVAGVFDVLHLNHVLALNHYRLLGARLFYVNQGIENPTVQELSKIAGSDKVKLVITLDSDARVAAAKSYQLDKGNGPRPILSWESRAMMMAQQCMNLPEGGGWPLVDLVTQHGVNSCICTSCPHDDNADMAIALNPDLLIVNAASKSTLARIEGKLGKSHLYVAHENKLAYHDSLLGGPIKCTSMIMRAKLH